MYTIIVRMWARRSCVGLKLVRLSGRLNEIIGVDVESLPDVDRWSVRYVSEPDVYDWLS